MRPHPRTRPPALHRRRRLRTRRAHPRRARGRARAVHESAIHGYAIYRAESESGPFVRINKDTIATTAIGEGGASYQWRDNTATSGKTYWYYVGLLNKDGSKGNLTPPQKAIAK